MLEQLFDCYFSINTEEDTENNQEENVNILYEIVNNIKIHELLNIDEKYRRQFALLIYKKEKYIFLNLFHREYNPYSKSKNKWSKNGNYKITIVLNEDLILEAPYDWLNIEDELELVDINDKNTTMLYNNNNDNNNNIGDDASDIDLRLSMTDIFYDVYHHYSENQEINIEESYNLLDYEVHNILFYNNDGLYFNINDIRWQTVLKELIFSYIGCNGKLINFINYKNYEYNDTKSNYYKSYTDSSIYEKDVFHNYKIICDLCTEYIETETFYHNYDSGDLCKKCFNIKKESDIKKFKIYWKLVLNEGKKIVFNRDLIEIQKYLEINQIQELPLEKKYTISKQISRYVLDNKKTPCNICLNPMYNNLYTGRCGHCFHKECIDNWNKFKCPTCRVPTNFIKLYI